jgi:2-amino-4-hydroxy-6-hydroxymethyldihydropteridine diphosphokinase
MTMSELAFISIGSNIDPQENLPRAISCLHEIGEVLCVSEVYQNPAYGATPQPDFLNAAALVRTDLSPQELHRRLRQIEARLGRLRTEDRFAPRTIDLDLSLYGEEIVVEEDIILPDPDLLILPHVAIPIAELDPEYLHPARGEVLQEIADRLRKGAHLTPRPDVREKIAAPYPASHGEQSPSPAASGT